MGFKGLGRQDSEGSLLESSAPFIIGVVEKIAGLSLTSMTSVDYITMVTKFFQKVFRAMQAGFLVCTVGGSGYEAGIDLERRPVCPETSRRISGRPYMQSRYCGVRFCPVVLGHSV